MRLPIVISLLLCLFLSACGKSVPTAPRYELPATPGGRMCVHQCNEARDRCREKCGLDQRGCTAAMQTQAMKDYEAYAQEQIKMRMPLDLRPSDFERPEKCKPTVCNEECEKPYQSCYEKCGGKIVATQSCKYFCF